MLDYLPSCWVMELWLTGSVPLRHLLSQRVSKLSLSAANSSDLSSGRWPRFISELSKLSSLTIYADNKRLAKASYIWECLCQLTHLKQLSITCAEAEDWLFTEDDFNLALPLIFDPEAEDLIDSHPTEFRPIAEKFLKLESLTLKGDNDRLRPEHLDKLPVSLTHLGLPSNTQMQPSCFTALSKLPLIRSVALSFGLASHIDEQVKCPPTITNLEMRTNVPLTVPANFWNGCTELLRLVGLFTLESLLLLPTTLEHLESQWSSRPLPNSFEHLPRLKSLKIATGVMSDCNFPSLGPASKIEALDVRRPTTQTDAGQLLPMTTSLTSLSSNWTLISSVSAQSMFEELMRFSNLRSLNLAMKCPILAQWFEILPPSLTRFSIRPDGESFPGDTNIAINTSKLPRSLRILIVENLTYVLLQANSYAYLPPYLEVLQVYLAPPDQAKAGASKAQPTSSPQRLPRYLRELRVTQASSDLSFLEGLDILHTLEVECVQKTNWTREMSEKLPRSLSYLSVTTATIQRNSVEALPQSLRSLLLYYQPVQDIDKISSKDFGLLPRNLVTLRCNHHKATNSDLAMLPATLGLLDMTASPEMTPEAWNFLPRSCQWEVGYIAQSNWKTFQALRADITSRPIAEPDPRVRGKKFIF